MDSKHIADVIYAALKRTKRTLRVHPCYLAAVLSLAARGKVEMLESGQIVNGCLLVRTTKPEMVNAWDWEMR